MPAETARWVAEALEEVAAKVRDRGLVDFAITRTADVEEFGPVEGNGVMWRNRRPTGAQTITMRLSIETLDVEIPASTT